MRIYTKTGDEGGTGLYKGARVSKDHPRIEAIGAVDELNSWFGICLIDCQGYPLDLLYLIQGDLMRVGTDLASIGNGETVEGKNNTVQRINEQDTARLEELIDDMEKELPPLTRFILPGGCEAAARIHMARAICRRAERRIVSLSRIGGTSGLEEVLRYINRLGDFLFVLARYINHLAHERDVFWTP